MAQKSRPDPANGTVVSADEYEGLSLSSFTDGIVGTPADTAAVYADSTGRQVKVRAGKLASIRGYSWQSDPTADEIINNAGAGLPANTSGNPRIDRLVLRLDRAARTVRTVYLQGTAAVTPAAPALTQSTSLSSGLWDFPFARWNVANGYTTIAAADIVTEAWYRAPGVGDTVLCTSTSRPFGAYLYNGLPICETDTRFTYLYNGTKYMRDPARAKGAQTFFANTTLAAVTGMTIPLEINSVYEWDLFAYVGGLQNVGLTLALQLPASATVDAQTLGWRDDTGAFLAASTLGGSGNAPLHSGNGWGYNGSGNFSTVTCKGTITTGSTAGNAVLLGSQRVSSANQSQVSSAWMETRQIS